MPIGKAVYPKKILLRVWILICQELLLGFGLISSWERNSRSIVGFICTEIDVSDDFACDLHEQCIQHDI